MSWQDPQSIELSRLAVAATVPSESGVFAVCEHGEYIFFDDTWNLKARLMEIMSIIEDAGRYTVVYEVCSDAERGPRRNVLVNEYQPPAAVLASQFTAKGLKARM